MSLEPDLIYFGSVDLIQPQSCISAFCLITLAVTDLHISSHLKTNFAMQKYNHESPQNLGFGVPKKPTHRILTEWTKHCHRK